MINKSNYLSIMKHNENFEQLLNKLDETDYIGLGNPNSKILFIGKELAGELNSEIEHGCVKHWKSGNNYAIRYEPEGKTRNHQGTWQRYQKLYDAITSKMGSPKSQNSEKEITFVEDVFTTEFSQLPAPVARIATSHPEFNPQLERRKELFFYSDFIQEFQIVIIFSPDNKYIETYPGEVEELFGVRFIELQHEIKAKIWINKGSTPTGKPKIVIHTYQLANYHGKIDDFIEHLSQLVYEFASNNDISSLS